MRAQTVITPATLLAISALLFMHPQSVWSAPPTRPGDATSVQTALESAAVQLNAGKAREALETLRPVERLEPDNPWLTFYRGMAHLQLGNAYVAMEHFDRALDRLAALGDPEPDLADSARRYRLIARRQTFTASYRAGFAYDTNVSYLGSNVAIGPALISGQSDKAFVSRFELSYAPIATEHDTLALGTRVGNTWYRKLDEYNYQDYGATVRYARRLDEHWELSLRYDYDFTLLSNEPFLSNHSLTPAIDYHWRMAPEPFSPDTTSVYYQFTGQDYKYDTTQPYQRDGWANAVGIEQTFALRLLPNAIRNIEFSCGFRYEQFNTRGTEFAYIARPFHAGVVVPLLNPWSPHQYLILPDRELMLRFNGTWELDSYKNASLIDRYHRNRRDLLRTYSLALSQQLLHHPRFGDLTLHAIVEWTDADSNVSISDGVYPFTYNKNLYGIQLEWTW